MSSSRAAQAGWLALALASGCSFSAEKDSLARNTCDTMADCASGAECRDGMCVGATGSTLELSLEVTPMRMPDGSQPVPIAFGPFSPNGNPKRTIELPTPVMTNGTVRDGKKHIAAQLHFTPMRDPALPPPSWQLATTNNTPAPSTTSDAGAQGADGDDADFTVQLLSGVRYHVLVEPTDTALPPYTAEFTPDDGPLAIDYAKVRWTVQRFFVQDAPSDRKLVMRAIDAVTGEPVSSSAKVTDAPATLVFGPSPTPDFRLELTAEESYATTAMQGAPCDRTTPVFPVLRVAKAALKDDELGTHVFVMPEIPATIDYSGVVQLCRGSDVKGLNGMPMALDARTLLLDGDPNVEARYNATTTATLDKDSGELRFCTRVLPGEYVVVITPPVNVACEIFAEHRRIESGAGEAVADVVLSLREAATLRGVLQTPDHSAVAAASVEAHALGRDLSLGGNADAGDTDTGSVATYNRSAQGTTDANGGIELPIDVGVYDIAWKPAPGSDFAWQVMYDVAIDAPSDTFSTKVVLRAPLVIDGKLRYAGASPSTQRSLAGADVHAYARIQTGETSRTIEVARSTADEAGNVTLLIAPELHRGL